MVEITDCRKDTRVEFKNLCDGTFFMYCGNFYLTIPYVFKTGQDTVNCYCLSLPKLSYIPFDAKVQPVNVSISILSNSTKGDL